MGAIRSKEGEQLFDFAWTLGGGGTFFNDERRMKGGTWRRVEKKPMV